MSILLIELTQKYLRLMEGTFGFGKFKLTQSGVFYLPEQLRKEGLFADISILIHFINDCIAEHHFHKYRAILVLEDEIVVSKEFMHQTPKKKAAESLHALATLEAESVFHGNPTEMTVETFRYGDRDFLSGERKSVLYSIPTRLCNRLSHEFSTKGIHLIKITPKAHAFLQAVSTACKKPGFLHQLKPGATAFLDFSTTKTTLALFESGTPVYEREFLGIYKDIVDNLRRTLYVTRDIALDLLTKNGFQAENPEYEAYPDAYRRICLVIDTLMDEMMRSVRIVLSSQRLELGQIVVSGKLSSFPYLDGYLARSTDIPCTSIGSLTGFLAPEFTIDSRLDSGAGLAADCFATAGAAYETKGNDVNFLRGFIDRRRNLTFNTIAFSAISLVTLLLFCIEPILHGVVQGQVEQDNRTLATLPYVQTQEKLDDIERLGRQIAACEKDKETLPFHQSSANDAVTKLLSQFSAQSTITSFHLNNQQGTIALYFETPTFNDYITLKDEVYQNDEFDIAIPFSCTVNDKTGAATCQVTLAIVDFVPYEAAGGGKE